jgi:hypothetical protein
VQRALGVAVAPNIEGALVSSERLVLAHRGVGGQASALVALSADVLAGAAPVVHAVEVLRLGALESVPLGVTDLAATSRGTCFFVAAAEDTDDAVADGAVAGSVLGTIGGNTRGRTVRWAALCDARGAPLRDKVEGLVVDEQATGAWILSDADDPLRAAELCRVELVGDWPA